MREVAFDAISGRATNKMSRSRTAIALYMNASYPPPPQPLLVRMLNPRSLIMLT
jgi:hypothetical protein